MTQLTTPSAGDVERVARALCNSFDMDPDGYSLDGRLRWKCLEIHAYAVISAITPSPTTDTAGLRLDEVEAFCEARVRHFWNGALGMENLHEETADDLRKKMRTYLSKAIVDKDALATTPQARGDGPRAYRCAVCGSNDSQAYMNCQHPLCPDGRDQAAPERSEAASCNHAYVEGVLGWQCVYCNHIRSEAAPNTEPGWVRCAPQEPNENEPGEVWCVVQDGTYDGTRVSIHRDLIRRDLIPTDRVPNTEQAIREEITSSSDEVMARVDDFIWARDMACMTETPEDWHCAEQARNRLVSSVIRARSTVTAESPPCDCPAGQSGWSHASWCAKERGNRDAGSAPVTPGPTECFGPENCQKIEDMLADERERVMDLHAEIDDLNDKLAAASPDQPMGKQTYTQNGKLKIEVSELRDDNRTLIQVREGGFSIAMDANQWRFVELYARFVFPQSDADEAQPDQPQAAPDGRPKLSAADLLNGLQWSAPGGNCPACRNPRAYGHAPDCPMPDALAEPRPDQPQAALDAIEHAREIVANGCGCNRDCERDEGGHCGCRKDARSVLALAALQPRSDHGK